MEKCLDCGVLKDQIRHDLVILDDRLRWVERASGCLLVGTATVIITVTVSLVVAAGFGLL